MTIKFACWDIRELQQAKMVAYAQALQFWAEKANLPTQGQPCLLAGSIAELKEGMKCYVSFSDKDIFSGMALPKEPSITQSKEAAPESAQPMQTNSPVEEAVMKVTEEPTKKKQPQNQFPGWKEVIHPSRPVVATGQIPPVSQGSKQRPHSWEFWEEDGLTTAARWVEGIQHQVRTPITHKRAGDCPVSDATSWLHRSDCYLWRDPLPEMFMKCPRTP